MIHLYKKFLLLLGVIFYLCFTASNVWSKSGVDLVEIKLLNDLDDKRGFCIDIKGYKFRAKIKEEFKHIPVTLIKERLLLIKV